MAKSKKSKEKSKKAKKKKEIATIEGVRPFTIQYNYDGTIAQYMVPVLRCSCGCNVFHHYFNGRKIEVACNACGKVAAHIKNKCTSKTLKEGIWR